MRILGRSTPKLLGACIAFGALACLAAAGRAADGAPAAAQARAASAAAAPASAARRGTAAADGHHIVEDEGVRIDELRIRGEVQSINVHSKLRGSPPYEVLVRPRGRDPSQDAGAAGRSVWSLLSF